MARAGVAAILVFILAVGFAGCAAPTDLIGAEFDAIQAPVWKAGYEWAYNVRYSESHSFGDKADADSNDAKFKMRVFNTTEPFDDEPAYYVRNTGGSTQMAMPAAPITVLRKSDLSMVGASRNDYNRYVSQEIRMDAPYPHSAPYDWVGYACEAVETVRPTSDEGGLQSLRFPLNEGQSWKGDLSPEEVFEGFQYTVHVNGLVPIEVPAGKFEAVYIRVEFAPPEGFLKGLSDDDEMQAMDLEFVAEYWYDADVGYFVKTLIRASMHAANLRGQSASYGFSSVAELTSYAQNDASEEKAPEREVWDERAPYVHHSWGIVADHDLPLDLSSAKHVTFGLEERGDYYADVPDTEEKASAVRALDIDHDRYAVYWTFRNLTSVVQKEGDTATFEFDHPEAASLTAEVRSKRCGESGLGGTSRTIPVFAVYSFSQHIGTGLASTATLGSFPLLQPGSVRVTWTPTWGLVQDSATMQLEDPQGSAQTLYASPYEFNQNVGDPSKLGTWTLKWKTTGVVVGHDIDAEVRVDYRTLYDYCCWD